MALSESTLNKLRDESVNLGGRVYEEKQDAHEEDVTHFGEDDNPLKLVGDFVDDASGKES